MASVGLIALLAGSLAPVTAAPGEDDTPIANPDLEAACGIDILMILDESGSIGSAGATGAVQNAFRAFTRALNNTGSRLAVAEFSTVARLPLLPAAASRAYTTVTNATIAATFDPYIAGFNPSGSTHWEDGFRVGRYFLPRPSPDIPHLTVFITDGDPNVIVRQDRVTFDPGNPVIAQNQYELQVPLVTTPSSANQTQSENENPAKDRAVPNANALKAQGSHILTIAVGNGLQSQSSLNRIIAMSGPDVFPDTGPFDITTTDVYREPNFALLEAALREAAFQLCAPSVNIRKMVDQNPDPAVDDLQPAQDWSMTATVAPTPASWVSPPGGTGATATDTTGPDGFANFQWTTAAPINSSITVTEVVQPGFVNDPSATTCTFRTPDTPADQPLPGFVATPGGFRGTVPDEAIVTCEMVNRIPPAPAIELEKSTNGDDADAPTGPFVPIGSTVTWTYHVTNIGNVPVSALAVTDNQPGVTVACPATTLAPGADTTCTATGTAVAGQYANIGTASATGAGPAGPVTVTDTDPSHYFGVAPGVDIEKFTNGVDADEAPGPFIPVGDPVTWTYVVTNTGNAPLTGATVTDDVIGTIACPAAIDPLDVGEIVTCTAPTTTAVAGQYENVGSVLANSPTGVVQDSDASHYFGEAPAIDIEKFTNGEDADTPTGPVIAVGRPVAWTYVVTNTGNVPLTWSVTDDQFPAVGCPRLLLIVPGQTVRCFGPFGATAQPGQHTNTATAVGTSPSGAVVTDADPSHYFGAVGGIDIEKFTNGVDVNQPPGPFVVPGSTVTWTYVVTNTGNVPLTDVAVDDHRSVLRGIVALCPQTTLAVDESMTCTATGPAEPDQYTNLATATGITSTGQMVQDVDPSAYFGSVPGIDLQKWTNGDDADEAPGPFIRVGAPVDWSYIVTNSGNAPLSDVVVTDDVLGPIACPPEIDPLDVGEAVTCTTTGTAAIGQYANVGTATGVGPAGQSVTDTDPSHYFGTVSAIDIEKATNGEDADTAPGVFVPVGDAIDWTYVVTNPGNVPIKTLTVTDDQGVMPTFVGGDADGDTELDPGEAWTFEASSTAVAGQYTNVATVNGFDVLEEPVTDSDPSNYFGFVSDIDIEKATNGQDADAAPGVFVPVGDPVTWTYAVTNPGNVPIINVTVTDDQGVVPAFVGGDADGDTELDPGETWTYEASSTAAAGQYTNVATVNGFDVLQEPVTDSDPSNYFGSEPGISIEKTADQETVNLGDSATFTITVTNTGNVPLTDVTVSDPTVPDCDRAIGDLAVGQSVTYACTVDEVLAPIHNVATVTGEDPGGGGESDEDDATVEPIPPAVLGDLVWDDRNRNQRQDAGEPGIADAEIIITGPTVATGDTTADVAAVLVATTDADGHYLVTLVPGEYVVALDMDSVTGQLTTPGSYTITLEPDDERLDADFGLATGSGAVAPDTAADGPVAAAIREFEQNPFQAGLLIAATAGGILALIALAIRRRQLHRGGAGADRLPD